MKFKVQSIKLIGLVLLSFFSIYNNAVWGASFIYVIIPSAVFFVAALVEGFVLKKKILTVFLFCFAYIFSTCLSSYVDVDRSCVSLIIFCAFYVLAGSFEYDTDQLKIFIIAYMLIAFTVSCNVCIQWLRHNYVQIWLKRSSFYFLGHFKDPNYTFAYIAPAVVLSIMFFFQTRNKKYKLLLALNIAVALFTCLVASSRAGMLAIGLPIVLMVLKSNRISIKKKIQILLFAVLIITAGLYFMLNYYNEYALNRIFNDSEGGGRLTIWKSALEVFVDHPFIGGGYNSGSTVSLAATGYATHNIFLDILCDSGIVGTLLFFVFFLLNCMTRNKENKEFLTLFAISCFIPMFFINGFNTTTFFYPLIVLTVFSRYFEKHNYLELLPI